MNFLLRQKWVFLIFVLLGALLPNFADELSVLLFPLVIIVTTLNIYDAKFHSVGKENIKLIVKLLAINYVLLGGVLIISSFLFLDNPSWRLGMILLALAPPAMAIIPLTHLLSADLHDGALAEFIGYLLAVVLVPIVSLLAIGGDVGPFNLTQIVLALVLLPLIFSRLMTLKKIKYTEESGNLLYGIIIYILVGLAMPTVLNNFRETIPIFIILIVTTFVLGGAIYVLLIHKNEKEKIDILYALFATLKNASVAGILAIVLFNSSHPEAIVPIGIRELLLPFYIAFLQIIIKNHHMHCRNHEHGHLKHARLEKT